MNETNIVFLGDMRGLYHHGCRAVVEEFLRIADEVGCHKIETLPGHDWRTHEELCLRVKTLIINGEGSLHSDRPVVEEVLTLAEKRRTRRLPTTLVNFTWWKNSPAATKRLVAFDHLFCRDGQSARAVSEILQRDVAVVPDLAIGAGLRLDPLPYSDGMVIGDSTHKELSGQLSKLAQKTDTAQISILTSPEPVYEGEKAAKIRSRCQLYRRLGCVGYFLADSRYRSHLRGTKTLAEYQNRLNGKGLVTGRFHAVCLALAWRQAFLAVESNTGKISALLRDVGLDLEKRVCNLASLEKGCIVPSWTEEERELIETYLREVPNKQHQMVREIVFSD